MKIYNSFGKKLEDFQPPEPEHVILYVCGLTPYDHAHVGYGRTCVAFDVLKRYLQHNGHTVYHIQNITDVDDKILKRAKETGEAPEKLVARYHTEAVAALDALGVLRPDVYPKVTEHMADIVAFISKLMEKGYAYETETGVYFSVEKFKGYGKLSGQRKEELQAGARVEIDESKKSPLDFALWKKAKGALLEFDSPWGPGRPGWHIECSAMNAKHAGRTLDIHGGARDLIFPHHENEIAQSEAALEKPLARYWVHTGLVTVRGEKMSKSLGNFVRLADVVARFSSNTIRLFFLQTHYRSPIDYNEEQLHAAEESVERIFNTLGLLREEKAVKKNKADPPFQQETGVYVKEFYACMDRDFDTPDAIACLFTLLRTVNTHVSGNTVDHAALEKLEIDIEGMLGVLGLKAAGTALETKTDALNALLSAQGKTKEKTAAAALGTLIALRESFRKKKDFAASDKIRKELAAIGIVLEDKEGGVRWKAVNEGKS